jgi:transglutaminase-like putative cysteine protease
MNQRRQVTLVAAAATLLATAPLETIFATWTWSIDCLFAVGAVCLAALGTRALRAPMWAQMLAMAAALSIMVTWLFGSAGAIAGTIPTGTSLRHFGDLLRMAQSDINDYGIPVPDRQGLLFLTTLSVGLVAILVDLVTVGLRRPALAGFPMLAMYWIPVLVHPDSVSFIPFAVGAIGFLWLLVTDNVDRVRRFGRRFTGEGRDVDLWEPSPLAAAGRRLAVVGVVFAVVLPLAIPGMTNGLLDRFGTGSGQGIGPGNGRGTTVNLFSALSGQLNLTTSHDLVKVVTTDPQPYYLRIGEADRLTEAGFSSLPPGAGQSVTGNLPNPPASAGITQKKYQATVTISNDLNMSLLPVYTQPTKIQKLDSSWLYDQASGLLYSGRSSSAGKQYSFDYAHLDFNPQALSTAKPLGPQDPIQRTDTAVPSEPTVDAKVLELTSGKTTQYDKVLALYNYFSAANHFQYTLSTKSGTSGSDIVDFLTNKQGYCEQYASALAWMVRVAGIPARVAFGFTRGGHHEDNTYTLTNYNLHAWTEVYFAGYGWVPFDATPTASIAGSVSPSWAPDVNHTNDPGGSSAAGPTGPINPNAPSPGDRKLTDDPAGAAGALGAGRSGGPMWPWYLGGAVVLVLLLLALPTLRRSAARRRRRPRAAVPAGAIRPRTGTLDTASGNPVPAQPGPIDGPPSQMAVVPDDSWWEAVRLDAHAAWDELIDTLVDYDIAVDEAETPRVTVERLTGTLRLRPEATDGIRLVGRAEETARYARTPLFTPDLTGSLRTVRSAISRRAPRGTRLRAFLLPPSVLRRWRGGLVDHTNSVVSTVTRFRDRTVRMFSPRRLLNRAVR